MHLLQAAHGGVYNVPRQTCGANQGTHWWRLHHDAGPADAHEVIIEMTPLDQNGAQHIRSADELSIKLFQGPDCVVELGDVPSYERDANGNAISARFLIQVEENKAYEACLRVKAEDHTVWTGFEVSLKDANVFAFDWSPDTLDPGAVDAVTFNEGAQTFASLPTVSSLRFDPYFTGYAHAHADVTCTHSVQLLSNGAWVTVLSQALYDSAEHHYGEQYTSFTPLSNVTGIRFTSSPFMQWSYHSFGLGSIYLGW